MTTKENSKIDSRTQARAAIVNGGRVTLIRKRRRRRAAANDPGDAISLTRFLARIESATTAAEVRRVAIEFGKWQWTPAERRDVAAAVLRRLRALGVEYSQGGAA